VPKQHRFVPGPTRDDLTRTPEQGAEHPEVRRQRLRRERDERDRLRGWTLFGRTPTEDDFKRAGYERRTPGFQCSVRGCRKFPVEKLAELHVMLCEDHACYVWHHVGQEVRALRERTRRQQHVPGGPRDGDIYYLQVGEHLKIGFASDLDARLASYPPNTQFLAVHFGTTDDEAELHRRFRPLRVAGREWYRDSPILRDHIATVIAQHEQLDYDPFAHRRRQRGDGQFAKTPRGKA